MIEQILKAVLEMVRARRMRASHKHKWSEPYVGSVEGRGLSMFSVCLVCKVAAGAEWESALPVRTLMAAVHASVAEVETTGECAARADVSSTDVVDHFLKSISTSPPPR